MKRVYEVHVLVDRYEHKEYWIEAGSVAKAAQMAERLARRVRPVQYAPRVQKVKELGAVDAR